MKLHIFYKHYNISGYDGKQRPHWFDYEKCFQNLLETIKGENDIELHVLYDGKIIEDNFISNYKTEFTLHQFYHGNARQSSLEAFRYIKKITQNSQDTDLIYILENDYVHVKGWVGKIRELFNTYSNLNYVSLYDHNDKYFLPMYDNLASKIFTTPSHHWRTTPSTCGTYITNKKIFLEDYQVPFDMPGDHNKFLWLAENKKRFVVTPIPGLSTHCMENLLSPTINWKNILWK